MTQTAPRRFLARISLWTRLRAGRTTGRSGPRGQTAIASGLALLLAAGLLAGCSSGEPAPEEAAPAELAPSEETGAARTPAPRTVVPLEPLGEVTLADGFTFRWQAPEGAQVSSWRLRVFAGPERQVWSARELTATELVAPQDLLMKLEPGQSYTWRVAGHLEGVGRILSTDARIVAR